MMTEKRKTDTALFREKIEKKIAEILKLSIVLVASQEYRDGIISIFLDGARFAIRTLRELEEAERKARTSTFEHPEGCECSPLCDCRPEVENSVEEVRGLSHV